AMMGERSATWSVATGGSVISPFWGWSAKTRVSDGGRTPSYLVQMICRIAVLAGKLPGTAIEAGIRPLAAVEAGQVPGPQAHHLRVWVDADMWSCRFGMAVVVGTWRN